MKAITHLLYLTSILILSFQSAVAAIPTYEEQDISALYTEAPDGSLESLPISISDNGRYIAVNNQGDSTNPGTSDIWDFQNSDYAIEDAAIQAIHVNDSGNLAGGKDRTSTGAGISVCTLETAVNGSQICSFETTDELSWSHWDGSTLIPLRQFSNNNTYATNGFLFVNGAPVSDSNHEGPFHGLSDKAETLGLLYTNLAVRSVNDANFMVGNVRGENSYGRSSFEAGEAALQYYNGDTSYDVSEPLENYTFANAPNSDFFPVAINNAGTIIFADVTEGSAVELYQCGVDLTAIEQGTAPSELTCNTGSVQQPILSLPHTADQDAIGITGELNENGLFVYTLPYRDEQNNNTASHSGLIDLGESSPQIHDLSEPELLDLPASNNYTISVREMTENGDLLVAYSPLDNQSNGTITLLGTGTFGSIPENVNNLDIIPNTIEVDPLQDPNFKVDLEIENMQNIYGVEAHCSVNTDAAMFTDSSYASVPNSQTVPPTLTQGSWDGALTLTAPAEPINDETAVFATLDLTAMTTTAQATISCDALGSDQFGNAIEISSDEAVVQIDDGIHGGSGSISGQLALHFDEDVSGITVNLHHNGRTISTTTDADGNFSFDNLRDDDFTVSVNDDRVVRSCDNPTISGGNSVDLGEMHVHVGDVNNDGAIDIADFTFVAGRFGSNEGDSDYRARADFNSDGTINIQDLAVLGSHFGTTNCSP